MPHPKSPVTRRLSRSGESEYAINRQACRQRDVLDLLADSGLGRAGYAIVGQKEIDGALAASAEERRAWVDEAAGVQHGTGRAARGKRRRLASARTHLERVDDILREIETQREPLREEAETARRYKDAQSALRKIEVALLAAEATRAAREVNEHSERHEEAARRAREETARAEALEEEARRLAGDIAEKERETEQARAAVQEARSAAEGAEGDLRLAEERGRGLDELERALNEEGAAYAHRLADLQHDLDDSRRNAAEEQRVVDGLGAESAAAAQASPGLAGALREAEGALAVARASQGRSLKAQVDRAHRNERRAVAEREIRIADAALVAAQKSVAEAHTLLAVRETGFEEARRSVHEVEAALEALRGEEGPAAEALRKALAQRATTEGRRRGVEATLDADEGLPHGVRAVLDAKKKGLLPGQYLPVGRAIEADPELALALETALGASANDLIVPSEDEAKGAIEWLRTHRAGRATFQPIPLVRPAGVDSALRRLLGEPGVLGRASELVRCEAVHRPVIESLLGRVLVVETLDVALCLARTPGWSRMVTLAGEVVYSGGAVTGGVNPRSGLGLVQRRAEMRTLQAELDRLGAEITAMEERARARRARQESLLAELRAARAKAVEAEREREAVLAAHREHSREVVATERTVARLRAELASQAEPADEALPIVNLAAAEAERDAAAANLATHTARGREAEQRLSAARSRLRSAQERVQALQQRLKSAQEAEGTREARLKGLTPERERLLAQAAGARRRHEDAGLARGEAQESLATLELALASFARRRDEIAVEVKRARVAAGEQGEKGHREELIRVRAEARRAGALQRLLEEYGLGEADLVTVTEEPAPDAASLATRLRREIKAMGEVNLGAIAAYERLAARSEELEAQREDVRSGMAEVEAAMAELDRLTRERFLGAFAKLEAAYVETFERLFGGGQGRVFLTEPTHLLESGVDIEATPPGKRPQRLELLSGGERALCAVAFLLALLRVRPSPLVVLDEVDAPLDGRNVERFLAALKESAGATQYLLITHNPATIEAAPVWLGITMQEPGVSTLVPTTLAAAEA